MPWPKDPGRNRLARQRMSEAKKAAFADPEFRKRHGDARRGKVSSRKGKTFEEIYGPERAKLLKEASSFALKGRPAPWVSAALGGRKRPQLERDKIAEAMRKVVRTDEHKRNIGLARRGKRLSNHGRPLTPQHKQAMVEGMSRRWRSQSPTSIEVTVRNLLTGLGVDYEPSKRILNYIVDIFVPSRNLVIECDGSYWHSLPNRQEHDRIRDARLQASGYSVLRLQEPAIKDGRSEEILREVFRAG